jgi:uncharacterized protein YciI
MFDWQREVERYAMKYVMFYESADDVMSKAPAHFPAHKERLDEFHARGDLLMVGPFGDPQTEVDVGLQNSGGRRAVRQWRPVRAERCGATLYIREWNEVLAG